MTYGEIIETGEKMIKNAERVIDDCRPSYFNPETREINGAITDSCVIIPNAITFDLKDGNKIVFIIKKGGGGVC